MVTEHTLPSGSYDRFQELDFEEEFDGIWACASLVHVARRQTLDVWRRLSAALKPAGVCYTSYKYGDGERVDRGRHFNDYDEDSLRQLLQKLPDLSIVEVWVTDDVRPDRGSDRWLNAIARKKSISRTTEDLIP